MLKATEMQVCVSRLMMPAVPISLFAFLEPVAGRSTLAKLVASELAVAAGPVRRMCSEPAWQKKLHNADCL